MKGKDENAFSETYSSRGFELQKVAKVYESNLCRVLSVFPHSKIDLKKIRFSVS